MDDDEFDYSEDLESENSELDDEEVRQEFELDDLRTVITHDPHNAIVRLSAIAERCSSMHSINAAYEIMKYQSDQQAFQMVIRAVALTPSDVDSYARIGPLVASWALLVRSGLDKGANADDLLKLAFDALEMLKRSSQHRAYLKLLASVASSLIDLGRLDEALQMLHTKFNTDIEKIQVDTLWAPQLNYEVLVLELEICVRADPVDGRWLVACLERLYEINGIAPSLQKLRVDEAQARWFICEQRFEEAKLLLNKTVRGYEELQGHEDSQTLLARSLVFLILLSAALGEGQFNPKVELPFSRSSVDCISIQHAWSVSDCFAAPCVAKRASKMYEHLNLVEVWLRGEEWKVGSHAILQLVKDAFLRIQINQVLVQYSRIRWRSLVSSIHFPPGTDGEDVLTPSGFLKMISQGWLQGNFRLNLVDDTVDEIPPQFYGQRSAGASDSDNAIPLPQRYSDLKRSQMQTSEESSILNKWRKPRVPNVASSHKTNYPDDDICSLLSRTLELHREAMIE